MVMRLVRGAESSAPVALMRVKVKSSLASPSASFRIWIGTRMELAPSGMTMLPLVPM
jgi:hypothetical protein